MCGIAGILDLDGRAQREKTLDDMLWALRHRGPDDVGRHIGPGIALGIRRLAIVDPAGGGQPFLSECGNVAAVVNGEIYNHRQLRRRLEACGHRFVSASDAEVVVHLYEEFGEEFTGHLAGMYAVAVWDARARRVVLARDPLGIKPLLWRQTRHGVAFASELRALLGVEESPPISLHALDRFLLFRTAVGEDTIVEGIRRVLPGERVTVGASGAIRRIPPALPAQSGFQGDPRDAVDELDRRLQAAVRSHLQGDRPIGVLLSGGIDSGLMLHYAAEAAPDALRAYTAGFVGFGGEGEEFGFAAEMAERTRVPLVRLEIDAEAARRHLLALTREVDEPNGDPTALPLRAIAERAAQEVPVVLSGEGADELFAGYEGYGEPLVVDRVSRALPLWLRRRLAASRLPGRGLARRSLLPLEERYLGVGMSWTHRERRSLYTPEVLQVVGSDCPEGIAREAFLQARALGADWLQAMLAVDRAVWLPDEALLKLDRLTMSFGLEARVPYLDRSVVDLADRLPWEFKVHGSQRKWVLREVARRHLPLPAATRRKRGFPSPVSRLLGGPLHDLAYDVLTDQTARNRGFFDPDAVRRALGVLNGRPSHASRQVYVLLALELWLRQVYDASGDMPETDEERLYGA